MLGGGEVATLSKLSRHLAASSDGSGGHPTVARVARQSDHWCSLLRSSLSKRCACSAHLSAKHAAGLEEKRKWRVANGGKTMGVWHVGKNACENRGGVRGGEGGG